MSKEEVPPEYLLRVEEGDVQLNSFESSYLIQLPNQKTMVFKW